MGSERFGLLQAWRLSGCCSVLFPVAPWAINGFSLWNELMMIGVV